MSWFLSGCINLETPPSNTFAYSGGVPQPVAIHRWHNVLWTSVSGGSWGRIFRRLWWCSTARIAPEFAGFGRTCHQKGKLPFHFQVKLKFRFVNHHKFSVLSCIFPIQLFVFSFLYFLSLFHWDLLFHFYCINIVFSSVTFRISFNQLPRIFDQFVILIIELSTKTSKN